MISSFSHRPHAHSSYESRLSEKSIFRGMSDSPSYEHSRGFARLILSANSRKRSHQPFHSILLRHLLRVPTREIENAIGEVSDFGDSFYLIIRRFIRLFRFT